MYGHIWQSMLTIRPLCYFIHAHAWYSKGHNFPHCSYTETQTWVCIWKLLALIYVVGLSSKITSLKVQVWTFLQVYSDNICVSNFKYFLLPNSLYSVTCLVTFSCYDLDPCYSFLQPKWVFACPTHHTTYLLSINDVSCLNSIVRF